MFYIEKKSMVKYDFNFFKTFLFKLIRRPVFSILKHNLVDLSTKFSMFLSKKFKNRTGRSRLSFWGFAHLNMYFLEWIVSLCPENFVPDSVINQLCSIVDFRWISTYRWFFLIFEMKLLWIFFERYYRFTNEIFKVNWPY